MASNDFKLVKLLDPVVQIDVPIRFAGEWDAGTEYQVGDIVTYNSGAYIALGTSTGAQPDANPSLWQVIFNSPTIGTIAAASVEGNGTVESSFNCNVTRTAVGKYTVDFGNDTINGTYPIVFGTQGTNSDDIFISYNSRSATGFNIEVNLQDNGGFPGVPIDRAFSFYIPDLAGSQMTPPDSFDFTQAVPSTTWTINHNLGRRPITELYTVGGIEFEAEVVHTSINQTVVLLTTALAGSARLV